MDKFYTKAVNIIETTPQLLYGKSGVSSELIKKAELEVQLNFPDTYINFLKNFGTLSFGSCEVYGLIDDDFVHSCVPDAVWCTIEERKDGDMPSNLFVIYNTTMGELFCLDFNKLNGQGEPKVVTYYPGMENSDQPYEVLYDSFGEFLLDMVEQEIE